MKYRAIVKQSQGWWIGWLVDLPGVNAQEKTRGQCLESLRIGAEDMLESEISFVRDDEMTTIDVSDPQWLETAIV